MNIPKELQLKWYNREDQYWLNFDSIEILFNFLLYVNSKLTNVNSREPLDPIITIGYVKEMFLDKLQTIKGQHILHDMGIEKDESINKIADHSEMIAQSNFKWKVVIDGDTLNSDDKKLLYSSDTIIDILEQNISNYSSINPEKSKSLHLVKQCLETIFQNHKDYIFSSIIEGQNENSNI